MTNTGKCLNGKTIPTSDRIAHDTGSQPTSAPRAVFSNYTISEQTGTFLACAMQLSDLFSSIYDAVEKTYGSYQVDDVFNKYFSDKIFALETEIYEMVRISISENLGAGSNKI